MAKRDNQARYRDAHRDELREAGRDYYVRNKERMLAYQAEYHKRPEVIARKKAYRQRPDVMARKRAEYATPEGRAYAAEYSARPEQVAARRKRSRVLAGIVDATDELRTGPCPICERVATLCCDHDHGNGRIRGWVCKLCNTALGKLGDTAQGVRRALAYLEAYESSKAS